MFSISISTKSPTCASKGVWPRTVRLPQAVRLDPLGLRGIWMIPNERLQTECVIGQFIQSSRLDCSPAGDLRSGNCLTTTSLVGGGNPRQLPFGVRLGF